MDQVLLTSKEQQQQKENSTMSSLCKYNFKTKLFQRPLIYLFGNQWTLDQTENYFPFISSYLLSKKTVPFSTPDDFIWFYMYIYIYIPPNLNKDLSHS